VAKLKHCQALAEEVIRHCVEDTVKCPDNAYRALVGKSEAGRPLGRAGCRWGNSKTDHKKGVDWTNMTQDRDRLRTEDFGEHGYRNSGYAKIWEFLDYNLQLFRRASVSLRSLSL
jgi:hypothetical protein